MRLGLAAFLSPCAAMHDWLIHPPSSFPPATVAFDDGVLTLANSLVTRTFAVRDGMFACTGYQREGDDGEQPTDFLRAVKPEAIISLDDVEYYIGGAAAETSTSCEVAECPDAARRGIFTDDAALAGLVPNSSAWQYASHALASIEAPFEWTPGTRHSPSDVAWPPLGVAVDITFVPPASVPPAHARLSAVIRYELYQGAPLMTKRLTLVDAAPQPPFVEVTGAVVELLGLTQPASPLPLVSYAPSARGEWGDATAYAVQAVGFSNPTWGGGKGFPGLARAAPRRAAPPARTHAPPPALPAPGRARPPAAPRRRTARSQPAAPPAAAARRSCGPRRTRRTSAASRGRTTRPRGAPARCSRAARRARASRCCAPRT